MYRLCVGVFCVYNVRQYTHLRLFRFIHSDLHPLTVGHGQIRLERRLCNLGLGIFDSIKDRQ